MSLLRINCEKINSSIWWVLGWHTVVSQSLIQFYIKNIHHYITNSMVRALPSKFIVPQLVNKFHYFLQTG
jgi:hypothetical protein